MNDVTIIEQPNLAASSEAVGTIIIDWVPKESLLFCAVSSNESVTSRTLECDKELIEDVHDEFQTLLTKFAQEEYAPERVKAVFTQLQELGQSVLKKILPLEFSVTMQHWPAGSIVNIRTNESCIPWELLHDGDNFLGAKFILCRLPLVSERSRMPQTEACIAYVEGETIEGSVSPSEIFGNYPFPVQQPVPMTIDSLRELARRAIILHFFCRAETEGSTNSFRLGMDSHQKLLPAELLTFTLQENALVLANLCQSAETNLCLQGFIDFASEFYKAGAQAYIGAIAEIPAQSASFFSNLFYRYLQNTPAYKAVYLAKKQCHRLYMRTVIDSDLLQESETQMYHQEFEMHGGITNPFWLFYSYYGNPARWKPIQGEQ